MEALADKAQISHAYVSKLEAGHVERPSRIIVGKLVAALLPKDPSEDMSERLLEEGMIAAGYLPSDLHLSVEELRFLRTFRSAPESIQKAAIAVLSSQT